MQTLTVEEAQSQLSELIRHAANGEEVVITRGDGTAVRFFPVAARLAPRFGSAAGMVRIADDFDTPLEDFAAYEQ